MASLVPTIALGTVIAAVAMWLLWHRVPRRFALRNVTRRPTETALVVAGSLLGAALITGSFVVGDTLDASYRQTAHTQLGPIDETITVADPRRVDSVLARIRSIHDDRIDGVLPFVKVPASIAATRSGTKRAEPSAQLLELDFARARVFGGDPSATGIRGDTPSPGEVAITSDLADTLEVGPGDHVTAWLYGYRLRLEVSRVLPRLGLAGFWESGFQSTSPNAFVAPGTIERITARGVPKGAIPPWTTIAVSNRGGVEGGAHLTSEVVGLIHHALGPQSSLRAEPLKRTRLDDAETQGQQFSDLFLNIGAFAILAGVLLLVNIFVMLAEERKGQLGMLRAVGMRRSDLVRVFVVEGSVYSLLASALGAVAGIGVGWAIVKLAAPIFGGGSEFSLELNFAMTADSIVRGFVIGALISVMTVVFTSVRISRINIIRAIRDLPEPKLRRTRVVFLVLGSVGAVVVLGAFVATLGDNQAWAPAILGPPIAAFSLVPAFSRLIGRRITVMVAASLGLVWGIFGNRILDGQFFDAGDLVAFVFQGVLLTFCAVVLLTQMQENFEGAIRRVAASRLPLRLGLAYPLARRFRTGLTIGMYALVVFTITFIAVLSTIFGGQIDTATAKESGGFDMIVRASDANPPRPHELKSQPGIDRVATLWHGSALFNPAGVDKPQAWPLTGIDHELVRIGPPAVSERAPGLKSDGAMWRELLRDPKAIVVDDFFLQGGGGPPAAVVEVGQTLPVIDPITGKTSTRKVIGVTGSDQVFNGAFVSAHSARQIFSGRIAPNRFYVEAAGSQTELNQLAARLQGKFVRNGVEADTFRSIIEESQRFSVQFLKLMQGYLALGLLVGIAGLGVVMVRSVRERRREIGVLRALGFVAARVRSAFMLESGFQALEGILVGSTLALITAAQLVTNGDFGEGISFVIPWANVLLLCLSAWVASLLATAWPAQQASMTPPAVALRVAD